MIGTGLAMMFIGMGTVLIFLGIMVYCMELMSKAVARINEIYPEPVVVPAGAKAVRSEDADAEVAAAIVAAMFSKK